MTVVRAKFLSERCPAFLSAFLLVLWTAAPCSAQPHPATPPPVALAPEQGGGERRPITTDDLARLRDIDSLSLSQDGARFAILIRQADPSANTYRTAWYVGEVSGGALTFVGDGGDAPLVVQQDGSRVGDVRGSISRWSPDGRWLAYTLVRDGAVQLWRSRTDGRAQQQVAETAADIRDFSWSADSRQLLFSAGSTRAELRERMEARSRRGFRLEEFSYLFRAVNPGIPEVPLETDLAVWAVRASGGAPRQATDAERAMFVGLERAGHLSNAATPPVRRTDGATAWFANASETPLGLMPTVRLTASLSPGGADPISCTADDCSGRLFRRMWWSKDGHEVVFWRYERTTGRGNSFHAWSPATGQIRTILSAPDDVFSDCELGGTRIICLREAALQPRYIASLEVSSGHLSTVADVNPEFRSFDLGRIDRIEWDLPADTAELGYPAQGRGYVLYPPGFDPSRVYPAFIAPYIAEGFRRGDYGDEHPLLVYAANGFVVISSSFPIPLGSWGDSADTDAIARRTYAAELGFPHLTMLMESTFLALDTALARGGIDPQRVGIGGVSHGAFVPLYMLQSHDRLAALSVAGGGWNQTEYHFGRLPAPTSEGPRGAWPEALDFWSKIDPADHLSELEAPILFHSADGEVASLARLVRRMSDAHLPFDAYTFPGGHHIKWQPAHRLAIYNRNLDWFRFWLQDVEDPDPTKAEQYERWRQLRKLQCRNPRSLRDYCNAESAQAPTAR